MPARVWYLPIDGPGKPPRITRIDLAPVGWRAGGGAASASPSPQSHIEDAAGVLSAAQKAQTEIRLAAFERMTGHQLVVVTTPSLGGKEIARYATDLANERGIGRRSEEHTSELQSLMRTSYAVFCLKQ